MSGEESRPEIRRIVPTRHGQMHARLRGVGEGTGPAAAGRPLVLLHMSPRSSQMYVALQGRLRRPSIALDRLGYGFSDPPARPLTMSEYAEAALEALDRLGLHDRFDLLGMHTGALEAIEVAHRAPQRIGRVGLIALPCFDAEENAHGLASFARMAVQPEEDGSHLLAAWRGRFQYRQPPWDLADVQRRLVDYLLAERPGAAYEAVFRYDGAGRLRSLRVPVVAFAPRDDVYEVTLRSRPLLPEGAVYVDLPDFELDFLRTHTAEFAALLDLHMPAG
jgi:pimeloyl-ACP methyl ester carboxylesterase